MKRLHPQELYENNSYKGFKPRQVRAMAEHYGFVRSNDGKDSKHLKFTHRDYHNLTFNLQEGGGEVMQLYVKDAVACCLEVKRRNAQRKEPVFGDIPDWAHKALPEGNFERQEDNSFIYEADATQERRYLLRMHGDKLELSSLDYPREELKASYTVRDGSANIPSLKVLFDGLDAKVVQHQQAQEAKFADILQRLEHNHGYAVEREDGAIYLWHAGYREKIRIDVPECQRPVTDEVIEDLGAILEHSREQCLAQMEYLEGLQQRGWQVESHPANGSSASLHLSGPDGVEVAVPTYGLHALFDRELLEKSVQTAVAPPAMPTLQVQVPASAKPAVAQARGQEIMASTGKNTFLNR